MIELQCTRVKTVEMVLNSGLKVIIKKDFYTWLWNIKYEDGMLYAGPFKTKKEAMLRLKELKDCNY